MTERAQDPATRPGWPLWLGWGLATVTATGASGSLGLFVGAFSRPHAFGGRDGQGAAGLAALLLLVSLGAAVFAELAVLLTARRLRRGGVRWAFPLSLAGPAVASALGLAFGLWG